MNSSKRSQTFNKFVKYCESRGDHSLMLTLGKYLDFDEDDVNRICKFTSNDWMFLGDCKEWESIDNRNYFFRNSYYPDWWKICEPFLTQEQFCWLLAKENYLNLQIHYDLYIRMRVADSKPLEKLSSAKRPKKV